MTTTKRRQDDDAGGWQRTLLLGLSTLVIGFCGWWAAEVWTQVAHAGERISDMDARQRKLEALQEQQGIYNQRLLDLIEAERLKKLELEEERRERERRRGPQR